LKKAKILAGRGVGGAAEKILEVRDVTGVWIIELRKMSDGVSKTIRRRTRDYAERNGSKPP
jgi:hypothetical protein